MVEGTPLKGPLPLDKAIEYAGQILDALDAAHKKGITHRDLKPANILVTKQGIKLLDFGLAKQTAPLKEADVTRALTGQGQILGTLQYMSPEQLQGKEVDARSDLFSFGCVLYEMLTGKRAFEGSRAGQRDRGDSGAGAGAAGGRTAPRASDQAIVGKRPGPKVSDCARFESGAFLVLEQPPSVAPASGPTAALDRHSSARIGYHCILGGL